MPFFSGDRRTSDGLIGLLPALALLNGGREPAGLVLYFAASVVLFLSSMRKNGFPVTTLTAPLFSFLLVFAATAAFSIFTRMKGVTDLAALTAHCLNFATFTLHDDRAFREKFLAALIAVGSILSAAVILHAWKIVPFMPLPNQNLLAGFLNVGIIAAASAPAERSAVKKIFLFSSIALIAAAECVLLSKGALLALVPALVFLAFFKKRSILMPIAILLAAGLAVLNFSPGLMRSAADKAASIPTDLRVQIWKSAGKAFLEKPLFGWGPGSFEQVYETHRLPVESEIARYGQTTAFAHNEYLHFAVETGAAGLGCFLWLVSCVIFQIFRSRPVAEEDSWTFPAASAILLSLFIHAAVDFNLHLPLIGMVCAFAMSCISAAPRSVPVPVGKLVPVALVSVLAAVSAASAHYTAKFSRSLPGIKIASVLNPFDPDILLEAAERSQGTEKESALKRAVRMDPENHRTHAALARFYFSEKKVDASAEEYRAAIRRSPYNAFYYMELSDIAFIQSRFADARTLCIKAAELETLYFLAHARIAEIERAMGNPAAAEAARRNAEKILNARLVPNSEYAARLLGVSKK